MLPDYPAPGALLLRKRRGSRGGPGARMCYSQLFSKGPGKQHMRKTQLEEGGLI